MSFTVASLASGADDCRQYNRFRTPFADATTERLCLVPNLVAGHCYRFGVPLGMLDPVSCDGAGPATFRVTKTIEI